MDSGVVGGERPSLFCLVHSLSWVSRLSLFLAAVAFASPFLFFSAYWRRRFASRTSGSEGFET